MVIFFAIEIQKFHFIFKFIIFLCELGMNISVTISLCMGKKRNKFLDPKFPYFVIIYPSWIAPSSIIFLCPISMFLVPSFNVDVPGLGASLILSEPQVENFQVKQPLLLTQILGSV